MQIEQIHYGSVNRNRMKGYQVIGKSAGLDAAVASAFCQWAPSHNSLEVRKDQSPEDAWALSFFPLNGLDYAIARSVHGGPEYSGRGGLAVVTNAMVLSRRHLAAYENDPIAITRTAIALGHLILRAKNEDVLPTATLPKRPFSLPHTNTDFVDQGTSLLPEHAVRWISREACSLIRDQRKVMIVGESDPLPILSLIFAQLEPKERSEISFSCGLKSSSRRDFRLQFTCQEMTPRVQKDLDRSGIIAIDIARVLVESA